MSKGKRRGGFTAGDLRAEIKGGKRVPFYLLHGDEDFERERTVEWLLETLAPTAAGDFNSNVFHGDNLAVEDFLKVYQAYPMMSTHRLVILKSCEKLSVGNCRDLEIICNDPAETTLLIASGGKVDMRRKFFSALAKKGHAIQFRVPYENKLPLWIQNYVRSAGLQIEPEAVDLLRLYIGTNLRELASEIDKLATFLGANRRITREAVEQAVGWYRNAGIFDLADAVGNQNKKKSLSLLHNLLAQGEEPGRTVAMLTRHLRLLLKARDLMKTSLPREQMAIQLGVAPFFLNGYLTQARRQSARDLWGGLGLLLEADERLKSQSRRQQLTIMDLLIYRLCTGRPEVGVDRR